jgi:hypothetical protein
MRRPVVAAAPLCILCERVVGQVEDQESRNFHFADEKRTFQLTPTGLLMEAATGGSGLLA